MKQWDINLDSGGRLQVSQGCQVMRQAWLAPCYRWLIRHLGPLPDHVIDLIEVATAVHAADRLISRGVSGDPGSWSRHLRLRLPVRHLEPWLQPRVIEALTDALGFFTEDVWEFDFFSSSAGNDSAVQGVLPLVRPASVGLFSGGLDSLIGVAAQSDASPRTLLLLAVEMSSRLLRRQRQLLEAVQKSPVRVVKPIILPFLLRQRIPQRETEERSQRTRGFLFGSLAAAIANVSGAGEILVFENGIGAINLPLTTAQVGAQSTRSTHPVALRKLERFLGLLAQQDIRFRLPFLHATKGEACRVLAATAFRDLVAKTISCDSFPLRIEGKAQCGVCSSCLLRRQALWEAGLVDDPEGGYRYDIFGDTERIPEQELLPLKEMLWQIHRLRSALSREDGWRGLASEFPALREIAEEVAGEETSVEEAQRQLTRLYRRYSDEWSRFPAPLATIARSV